MANMATVMQAMKCSYAYICECFEKSIKGFYFQHLTTLSLVANNH